MKQTQNILQIENKTIKLLIIEQKEVSINIQLNFMIFNSKKMIENYIEDNLIQKELIQNALKH